jgi:hypothetical protein
LDSGPLYGGWTSSPTMVSSRPYPLRRGASAAGRPAADAPTPARLVRPQAAAGPLANPPDRSEMRGLRFVRPCAALAASPGALSPSYEVDADRSNIVRDALQHAPSLRDVGIIEVVEDMTANAGQVRPPSILQTVEAGVGGDGAPPAGIALASDPYPRARRGDALPGRCGQSASAPSSSTTGSAGDLLNNAPAPGECAALLADAAGRISPVDHLKPCGWTNSGRCAHEHARTHEHRDGCDDAEHDRPDTRP